MFEAREVEAEDKRWSMLQQNGPLSAVSDGLVKARLLFFNKQGKDSRVLVSYHDNLQVKKKLLVFATWVFILLYACRDALVETRAYTHGVHMPLPPNT